MKKIKAKRNIQLFRAGAIDWPNSAKEMFQAICRSNDELSIILCYSFGQNIKCEIIHTART